MVAPLFVSSLLLASAAALATGAPASKPNIIFFMADDLGWNNVEWHNPTQMKTPNAAALVKDGIELDRHYAFLYCSPSRSSLMTGRLPYHVQQTNYPNWDLAQGAPRNMTFIAAKLKQAGYQTVHVGKWHLGMSTKDHTPKGRGFDKSLVYFEGAEDHWTQRSCIDPECLEPITHNATLPAGYPINSSVTGFELSPYDLWMNDGPAKDIAGTKYNGYLFADFALDAIDTHDPAAGPLFMYLAAANSHTPLEAPQQFLDLYPEDWYLDRRQYAAMCSFWDEILGNVTKALKAKGIWDNTLLVFSSDNGGPAYWSLDPKFQHGSGANNWPLKGGKVSNWEGGTRVSAFASGGLVPASQRGSKLEEYIHMADWYATFCALAGVDPTDAVAARYGLPPIDSLDMWPMLSGANGTSPRTELPLAVDFTLAAKAAMGHKIPLPNGTSVNSSALIQGDWKLLKGVQVMSYYQGPEFPNASSAPYGQFTDKKLWHFCIPGCLYNIKTDPTEHDNVALRHPLKVLQMSRRLNELKKTRFEMKSNVDVIGCGTQIKNNGNFFGPWLN